VNGPCVGIDLNRNFGFHWNGKLKSNHFNYCQITDEYLLKKWVHNTEGGAAGNGCDNTYHGPSAFSEDESANVRDAILSVADRTKAYLTIHSYGQYWLTPWGYTTDLPDDYPLLVRMKKKTDFKANIKFSICPQCGLLIISKIFVSV
jgi:hypothetical protein